MNRFRLILFGALAILMAGCSKDNPQVPDKDAWMHDLNLPVPIEFGASGFGFETRAETVTYDNINNTNFYVWAADTSSAHSWSSDPEAVYLRNIEARMPVLDSESDAKPMQFVNSLGEKTTHYYPYGSSYKYSFFAVGLQTQRPVPVITENGCYAEINIGNDDILFAQTHAKNGYNARYIRMYYNQPEKLPKLQFAHKTTALYFIFKIRDKNDDGEYIKPVNAPSDVIVKSITFKDVPIKANFWLAHKSSTMAGVLESTQRGDLTIDFNTHVSDSVGLGYAFLFPQTKTDADCGKINATMIVEVPKTESSSGVVEYDEVSVALTLTRSKAIIDDTGVRKNQPFAAGYVFSYEIVMTSSMNISIDAGLNPWISGYIDKNSTTGTIIE